MRSWTYLLIDIGCIIIPLIASFDRRIRFDKELRYFLPANAIIGLAFIIWDSIFASAGYWGFSSIYTLPARIAGLPIEEILFFLCIPYACSFSYHAISKLMTNPSSRLILLGHIVNHIFLAGSIIFICYPSQAYTFYAGLFCLSYHLISYMLGRIDWQIGFIYLLIFPFFLISNGILTGTGLEQPIVFYNPAQIFEIRLLSIPIEDSLYGYLMIASNIMLLNIFKDRSIRSRLSSSQLS